VLYAHNGQQTTELNKKLLSAPVPVASASPSPAKSVAPAAPVASVAPAASPVASVAPSASPEASAAGGFSLSTGINPDNTPAAPFSSPAATPAK